MCTKVGRYPHAAAASTAVCVAAAEVCLGARALVVRPSLLLLDEPFSNLDTILSEKLFAFVTSEVRKNKTSVILITHLADEALKYADKLAVMDNGKIIQSGKKWQIYYFLFVKFQF